MAAGRFWTDGRFKTPWLFLLIVLRNTALDSPREEITDGR